MIPVILSPINGKGVASEVYQWDLGQQIVLTGTDVTDCVVQWVYDTLPDGTTTDNRTFSPLTGETGYTEGGIVDIPDAALMQTGEITGYIYYNGEETIGHIVVNPIPRAQPTDYVSPDNTVTLQDLIETAVDAAVAEAIDQLSFVAETYQSAEDLPADAATGTLAIIDPTPEWDRAPVQIFKGQFLRRIFINGDPPDPREVLPEDRPNTRGVIVENTDGETARMVLYFEAAKENDFLDGKPGIVVLWNFDENGDPAAASLYNTEPTEIEGEFCEAGWHIANFETGGIEPREFDEIDFPAFDFEPRMIFNPDWLPQVVPLGYSIATQASFDNRGLGYYMSVDPYKSKKIYHKKEAGWEEVK